MLTNAPSTQAPPRSLECDLVMKGGITSGIVYPPLVLKLYDNGYRFRNIGGTSAGAIAAAVTAAAECGRDTEEGGFQKLKEVSAKLREEGFVLNLFQPTGDTRPLMDTLFAMKAAGVKTAGGTKQPGAVGKAVRFARLSAAHRAVRFGSLLGKVLAEKNKGPYESGERKGGAVVALVALLVGSYATLAFFLAGLVGFLLLDRPAGIAWEPLLVQSLIGFVLIAVPITVGFGWLGAQVGGLAGGLHDLYGTLTDRVPRNFYGLCSGIKDKADPSRHEVLTEWLHAAIQELSGRTRDEAPLTFGDLWRWPEPREGEDVLKRKGRRVDLRMVSANLSQNQPYVLPFERDEVFIFKKVDLESLFPKSLVDYMVAKGEGRVRRGIELPAGCYFLPQAKDLPIIFATRMSLSFPVLIGMIPLYTISALAFPLEEQYRIEVEPHWPRGEKWDALKKTRYGGMPIVPHHLKAEWELETTEIIHLRKWEKGGRRWVDLEETYQIEDRDIGTAPQRTEPTLQKNWFSDGGICSNFPIHFFDAWLPTRPTFGVNLTSQLSDLGRPARPPVRTGNPAADGMALGAAAGARLGQPAITERKLKETVRSRMIVPTLPCDESADAAVERTPYADDREVVLPRPDDVIPPEWIAIDSLRKFLESIFRTAQNYRDNMQAALPSYRERIVQVRLTDQEGGLNLDMTGDIIKDVAEKGEKAGAELAERFAEVGPGGSNSLDAHKWVRFRVLMKQMESQLVDMYRIMSEDPFYRRIMDQAMRFDPKDLPYTPSEFKKDPPDTAWSGEILERLLHIGAVIGTFDPGDHLFARDPQPLPEPVLRVTPRI